MIPVSGEVRTPVRPGVKTYLRGAASRGQGPEVCSSYRSDGFAVFQVPARKCGTVEFDARRAEAA